MYSVVVHEIKNSLIKEYAQQAQKGDLAKAQIVQAYVEKNYGNIPLKKAVRMVLAEPTLVEEIINKERAIRDLFAYVRGPELRNPALIQELKDMFGIEIDEEYIEEHEDLFRSRF